MTESPLHPSRLLPLLTDTPGVGEKASESLIEQLLALDDGVGAAAADKALVAQALPAGSDRGSMAGSIAEPGTIPSAGEKIPGAGQ